MVPVHRKMCEYDLNYMVPVHHKMCEYDRNTARPSVWSQWVSDLRTRPKHATGTAKCVVPVGL